MDKGVGGLNQCGHFADKGGGGQFFTIFCRRFLWTAPNHSIKLEAT